MNELIAQEQLLPFLLNPRSYPHRPQRVVFVQTHSSFLFIAGAFVYKVKKAVNFGFLNFSTLAKRRYFCERELTLNQRLSPKMYLSVVPISMSNGLFEFGESGRIIEYAVKMRRLSPRGFLDKLVERGAVTKKDLDRVIGRLKQFYLAQHLSEEIEAWGHINRLKISTDENFRQTATFIGQTLSRPAFETIQFYTRQFYRKHRKLFQSRVKEHWIRDCHGDLHLEHIHLTPGALHIYDCIEFNDRLRYIDVANDVAFLAMDLDYEGRPDLARYFSAKIAKALNDSGMQRLLDFYKCYRAYVRGKVESLHSVTHAAPESERRSSAQRAGRYSRLALQYAVAGSEPLALVVMGRIASGKSTLARALGNELDWPVISSDRLRKELAGFPLFKRTSEALRTRLYLREMTEKVYKKLLDTAASHVREDRSVILEATFAQRRHREVLKRKFASRGIRFCLIEVQATDKIIKERLEAREAKADEVSDARLEDFETLTQLYQPPTEVDEKELVKVATSASLEVATIFALKEFVRRSAALLPS